MAGEDIDMLTDDQIDYGDLPDLTLRNLVVGEDLFVANSALTTLAMRKSQLAVELAEDIIVNTLGDAYLQAAAINILFDRDRERSLHLLITLIASCKPYVFNTILELMIQNSIFFRSTNALQVVRSALERIAQTDKSSKWSRREVIDGFLEIFGQGSGVKSFDGD